MPKKTSVVQAPFDHSGNLLHYAKKGGYLSEYDLNHVVWRDNLPVTLTLTLMGTIRGRSAAYFEWRDPQGHVYPMFISDMADLLHATTVQEGKVCANWIVAKRGANFGIRFYAAYGDLEGQ